METNQLLIEVKSIIGHAVCAIRADQSTPNQRDSALDNLTSAMMTIELHLSQLGERHD